jgi:hypothetical protein
VTSGRSARWWLLVPLALAAVAAATAAAAAEWERTYRPASVTYALYGGTLGDPVQPTRSDTKVAFNVGGRAARELFEAIGPDRRDGCSTQDGSRYRARDDDKLVCVRYADKTHQCFFGFDLRTGRSIGGSIC